ncbi:MAG: endonuclease domain-containing protein [Fimbriimonas ginsengisoli]|uniref:Endonuclease domain-containing protein n=1 Tax=Fimbriimonas ginsengisoli TaxID=1005039 RepID=A0A931PTG1_FIMGI|nr:endonuclease domain-containing protein [Fimbriimonas ginsengisoli]
MAEKKQILVARARTLRRDATKAERFLWGRLRRSSFPGIRWRRQQAIGPYIADFYCPAARLIVEIDGWSHDGRDRYDDSREAGLMALGHKVMRFSNSEVLSRLDSVEEAVWRECLSQCGLKPYANL